MIHWVSCMLRLGYFCRRFHLQHGGGCSFLTRLPRSARLTPFISDLTYHGLSKRPQRAKLAGRGVRRPKFGLDNRVASIQGSSATSGRRLLIRQVFGYAFVCMYITRVFYNPSDARPQTHPSTSIHSPKHQSCRHDKERRPPPAPSCC